MFSARDVAPLRTQVYARLLEIDAAASEPRARAILKGLGFTDAMVDGPVEQLSGGCCPVRRWAVHTARRVSYSASRDCMLHVVCLCPMQSLARCIPFHCMPVSTQYGMAGRGCSWRVRVGLAAAVFSAPDVLLLDEPTNHLSIEGLPTAQYSTREYPEHSTVLHSTLEYP
jgi:hypothetical protein